MPTNYDKLLALGLAVDLPDLLRLFQAVLDECASMSTDEREAMAYQAVSALMPTLRQAANFWIRG